MRTILIALSCAALSASLSLSFAGAAAAQKIDAAGKCHAADGKLAKMEVCKPAKAAPGAKCRDPKTKKFMACDKKGAEPVPAATGPAATAPAAAKAPAGKK